MYIGHDHSAQGIEGQWVTVELGVMVTFTVRIRVKGQGHGLGLGTGYVVSIASIEGKNGQRSDKLRTKHRRFN